MAVLAAGMGHGAAADTLTIDSNACLTFFGGMGGGSVQYELALGRADGLTLRAQADDGAFLDGGGFGALFALAGYRHHWDALYLELEAGYLGIRHERAPADDFGGAVGVRWYHLPDGQLTFGGRIGSVDLGVWTNIPAAGLGIHLGFAIDL